MVEGIPHLEWQHGGRYSTFRVAAWNVLKFIKNYDQRKHDEKKT